ncbi:hypothetical protein EJ08DRAFT_87431 [Tothia fuscella]|uniref:Uncharacterized protein n=1 Tax=Tothia fuscella TaxID=1048955 RepID=A0A9P4NXA1_9PEZI|nr:hypothetical protein EJ08DRAFT_87431 [Tothia fuscella]
MKTNQIEKTMDLPNPMADNYGSRTNFRSPAFSSFNDNNTITPDVDSDYAEQIFGVGDEREISEEREPKRVTRRQPPEDSDDSSEDEEFFLDEASDSELDLSEWEGSEPETETSLRKRMLEKRLEIREQRRKPRKAAKKAGRKAEAERKDDGENEKKDADKKGREREKLVVLEEPNNI